MTDFDCCARQGGHDVPDPFDAALGGAIRENRRLRGQLAELQAVIAAARFQITGDPYLWPREFVAETLKSAPSDVLAAHDAQVTADAWDEGEMDGQWNYEHMAMIERGNRTPIVNPYRQES